MKQGFWTGKRVAVTGAAGFIGSHAVDELIKRGAHVTAAVSAHSKENPSVNLRESYNKIMLVQADLLDYGQCERLSADQDIVCHFAALDGGMTYKLSHAQELFEGNLSLTENVLRAAAVRRVGRVLLMSSIEVYKRDLPSPVTEEAVDWYTPDALPYGYARAKLEAELMAEQYAKNKKLQVAIARAGNIYGPRDSTDKGRVIPTFISLAAKNKDITLYGDGSQRKSFLYITDAVDALLRLVEMYSVGDPVNIAGSHYVSIGTLAHEIVKLMKSKSRIVSGQKAATPAERVISVEKVKRVLQFKEKVSLTEGLSRVIVTSRSL